MTNEETLTKAIQKAIDGGWKIPTEFIADAGRADDKHTRLSFVDHRLFIFNHQFAKALWGEGLVIIRRVPATPWMADDDPECIVITSEAYKHHLQQMVIAEYPIQYLKENI